MKTTFLALLSATALAGFVDNRGGAKLKVTHPPDLVEEFKFGHIKTSLGNFGHI
jgi:hypothetical protein